MNAASKAIRFLETLAIPEGPKAGQLVELAPFQKRFVKGALADGVNVAVLSIGRGNAKTALSAGIALGAAMGDWDRQPRREVIIAARTRDQGRIAFDFAVGFIRGLPETVQAQFIICRSPRLEIEYEGDGGGHLIRVIAADGKSALGSAPTLVLMDERGHWSLDKGNDLEAALLSGLGKRGGRALIISTSAADDTHPFSKWIDDDQPGVHVQGCAVGRHAGRAPADPDQPSGPSHEGPCRVRCAALRAQQGRACTGRLSALICACRTHAERRQPGFSMPICRWPKSRPSWAGRCDMLLPRSSTTPGFPRTNPTRSL